MTLPIVRLTSVSRPVIREIPSTKELIPYYARVSNPENQENHATAPRLVRYLKREGHWSPFEMVHAVIEVTTTRDIARQILRHRSFSFQEFSQRYAVAELAPPRECRMSDKKNRQNSLPCSDSELAEWWAAEQQKLLACAAEVYSRAVEQGVAKEVARAVLPEGLTISRLYVGGTIRSWMHYIKQRAAKGTQKEHRDIAALCAKELHAEFGALFPTPRR